MTGSPRLTIIADDLTGAADTGAPFALAGFVTTIVMADTQPAATDVLVINTNSRGLAEADAALANRLAVETWVPSPGDGARGWVYKKIDSALRGHPAAELAAVMNALGTQKVLVAPALPQEGRTTVGGRQHLDGVPLEKTAFGELGVDSNVLGLFERTHPHGSIPLDLATVRRGPTAIAQFLATVEAGIIVADAETTTDLAFLARSVVASGLTLVSGTAGFARELALVLPATRRPMPSRPSGDGHFGTLIVAGSRDRVTAEQVDHLRAQGVPIVSLAAYHLDGHLLDAEVIAPLAERLRQGDPVVLTTVGLHSPTHGAGEVRERIASIVARPDIRSCLGGLVLTGGDVAMGTLQKLGVTDLRLGGEVRPALPWTVARFADDTALPVVTKAGSFGEADALLACLHLLQSDH